MAGAPGATPANLIGMSGVHIPAEATGGAAGFVALVGMGAGMGVALFDDEGGGGALVLLYWERRLSLSFWSWRELVCARLRADMAFERSLRGFSVSGSLPFSPTGEEGGRLTFLFGRIPCAAGNGSLGTRRGSG